MKNNVWMLKVLASLLSILVLSLFYITRNIRYADDVSTRYQTNASMKDKGVIENQTPAHARNINVHLNIDTLQKLVNNDSAKGPIVISDTNIENFLSMVEKDNQNWNISTLTNDEIKDITDTRSK